MVPEAHGAQLLLDPDYMPNMCFTPTKTLVCYIFGFIKFSPKHTVEAAEPLQFHFGPHYPWLGSGLDLGGQDLIKLTTGKVHNNFCKINFA
jgi:hypothetical protein